MSDSFHEYLKHRIAAKQARENDNLTEHYQHKQQARQVSSPTMRPNDAVKIRD